MHGSIVRAGLVSLVATLVHVVPGVVPAHAFSDTASVAIPRDLRSEPRGAGIVGEGSKGLVYTREGEPTSPTLRGAGETFLRAADGTETRLTEPATRVYGDRLIGWSNATEVHSRVLPDGAWQTTLVPSGHTLVAITGDGLLLVHGPSGDRSLAVLPWSGGAPLAVTGLPAGRSVDTMVHPPVAHAAGAVVQTSWSSGQQSESVYVDTAQRTAFPLGVSRWIWGLGEDTLAWLTSGSNGERLIGTMARPTQAVPTPRSSTRPVPVTPGWDQSFNVSLLPVGDDVVVWRGGSLSWSQFSAATAAPVVAVAPDGTSRNLAGWGHDVRPAAVPGSILVVTGQDATTSAVRRVEVATGSSTVVVPLAPVAAWTTRVAAYDGGVAYIDNSVPDGALKERTVTGSGTPQLGAGRRLGEPVELQSCPSYPDDRCATLVAGDGSLAWVEDAVSSVRKWGLRTPDGTVRTGVVPDTVSARGLTAVSGPWLMLDGQHLLDTRTGTATRVTDQGGADLLDGVAYVPGSAMETTPQGSVLVRVLDAGTAATITVPGCLRAGSVQAAGSWLLVGCTTAAGAAQVVVDRTGGTATWSLPPGAYYLGNGFVVRRDKDDLLSWTALSGGTADWHDLGIAGDHWATASVNRGTEPYAAWIDRTGQARLERLPVTTSRLPARPSTALSAPMAPKVTTDAADGQVTVEWAASAAEKVTGYIVGGGVDRSVRVLGPTETSATFRNLKNGSTYSFWVTAQNIAGESTRSVTATPLGRPNAPENIRVAVDETTSTAKVTWTWWQAPATEPVTSFDIEVGRPVATGLPATARSAQITVPWPSTGPVTVVANGEHGARSADSASVTFPGVDSTAPQVTAPAVRRVLLGAETVVRLAARDDRAVASLDLRWRSAASGRSLGSWQYPSAWQRRDTGRLRVSGLRRGHTYCFSSRARDEAGNVSRWTPALCTTVALDDRALVRSGSWRLPTAQRFYLGTASSTRSRLATLSRKGVRADSAHLVATTCPTCGTLRVQVGHDEWGTVRLRSAVRRDRQVVALPWPMRLQGPLVLRPVAGTGPVTVDGIALRSY